MVDDFTHDFLLQVCEGVQGRQVNAKKRKIYYQHCEKCNVERIMYPHLGFYVCLSCGVCGDDICIRGYDESTVMHKKGDVFVKEMNIFDRKLESSYVENLLKSVIVCYDY